MNDYKLVNFGKIGNKKIKSFKSNKQRRNFFFSLFEKKGPKDTVFKELVSREESCLQQETKKGCEENDQKNHFLAHRTQRSRCVFPAIHTSLTCLDDYSYPNKSLFHVLEHPDCIAAAGKASQSERKQPTRHVALPPQF